KAKWEYHEAAKLARSGRPLAGSQWKARYKRPAHTTPGSEDLPEIPTNWIWTVVDALSIAVVDGVHKKPNYVAKGVPFVTVRNLTAGPGIDLVHLNYVTEKDHQKFIGRAHPQRGDLLVTKDGTLGVVRAIRTDSVFSIFVSVALVKPITTDLTDYLELALSCP